MKKTTSKPITKEVLKGYLISPEQLQVVSNFIRSLSFNIDQVNRYQHALDVHQVLANLATHTEEEEVEPKKAKQDGDINAKNASN